MKPVVITLRDKAYFSVAEIRPEALKEIKKTFTYKNPQYAKQKSMGYATKEPPIYETWDQDEQNFTEFHVWRGAAVRLSQILKKHGYQVKWRDSRLSLKETGLTMGSLAPRDYQQAGADVFLQKEQGIVRGETGSGKCLGKGTPVMKWDGSVVPVEELKIGDQLIGHDSKPRTIQSLARGRENLYKIMPTKGEEWVCNESHILTLVHTSSGEMVDVSVSDYMQWNKSKKRLHKQVRTGVEWGFRETELEPYFLGLWLGDGRFDSAVICKDVPVITSWLQKYVDEKFSQDGFSLKKYEYGNSRIPTYAFTRDNYTNEVNKINRALNSARVNGEKRIPKDYLINSREMRMCLLAGILDTDGSVSGTGFDFVSKYNGFAHDVVFLARSLGLAAYLKPKWVKLDYWDKPRKYWRVSISGECWKIPTIYKKAPRGNPNRSVLRTGVKVEFIGEGDYYGFTLKEEPHFLLGDFTVTHNTETLLTAIVEAQQPALVVVWNKDLQGQWIDRIIKYGILPKDEIGGLGGMFNKKSHGLITVAMQQSLVRNLHDFMPRYGTIVLDECQRAPATTVFKTIIHSPAKYRWAVSANERRNDRKEFLTYDAFGPVLHTLDSGEATLEPEIHIIPTEYEDPVYEEEKHFLGAISRMVVNEDRIRIIERFVMKELENGRQCLLFTERVKDAENWARRVSDWGFEAGALIGGVENKEHTTAVLRGLRSGKIQFAAATSYGDVGLDVPSLEVGFISCPAGNDKRLQQQVGRIIRPSEGKTKARIYYFWDRYVAGLSKKHKVFLKKWKNVSMYEEADVHAIEG